MKCHKKKFKNREDALQLLWKLVKNSSHNKNRKEKRTYFCKKCQAYHLTSKGDAKTTRDISNLYINEVLYGKENREKFRLMHFNLDKACEDAKKEVFKKIDWMFYVERLKFEDRFDKLLKKLKKSDAWSN